MHFPFTPKTLDSHSNVLRITYTIDHRPFSMASPKLAYQSYYYLYRCAWQWCAWWWWCIFVLISRTLCLVCSMCSNTLHVIICGYEWYVRRYGCCVTQNRKICTQIGSCIVVTYQIIFAILFMFRVFTIITWCWIWWFVLMICENSLYKFCHIYFIQAFQFGALSDKHSNLFYLNYNNNWIIYVLCKHTPHTAPRKLYSLHRIYSAHTIYTNNNNQNFVTNLFIPYKGLAYCMNSPENVL